MTVYYLQKTFKNFSDTLVVPLLFATIIVMQQPTIIHNFDKE